MASSISRFSGASVQRPKHIKVPRGSVPDSIKQTVHLSPLEEETLMRIPTGGAPIYELATTFCRAHSSILRALHSLSTKGLVTIITIPDTRRRVVYLVDDAPKDHKQYSDLEICILVAIGDEKRTLQQIDKTLGGPDESNLRKKLMTMTGQGLLDRLPAPRGGRPHIYNVTASGLKRLEAFYAQQEDIKGTGNVKTRTGVLVPVPKRKPRKV